MNFQPFDRLPIVEWAMWWDKTVAAWQAQGLDKGLDRYGLYRHFGLDMWYQDWVAPWVPAARSHGAAVVNTAAEYAELRQTLYRKDPVNLGMWRQWAEEQRRGDAVLWVTLQGFFWYPRTLFGIEPHLYAFYDQPELMHQMNEDLLAWNLEVIEAICEVTVPDFMTFAEDMSYNHGPMLSKELFDEFLAPYYRRIVPELQRRGILTVIDSDGDITEAAGWYGGCGIDGMLPLERQAGVDMAELRRRYPAMRFIGHFDKMTMPRGREAMAAEFERLLPVARQGGFIPGVDHQTPPGVTLAQYGEYLELYRAFAERAGRSEVVK